MNAVTSILEKGDKTIVTTKSIFTNKINTMIIDVKFDDFKNSVYEYRKGELIQKAFPYLSSSQREMLMTGMDDSEFPSEEE